MTGSQEPVPNARGRSSRTVVVLSALTVLIVSAGAWLHAAPPQAAPDGADLFKTYCASCHGAGGTGHGPMAPALRHVPPDLTQLSKTNGYVFPSVRVRRIIEGRDVESHGDRDMPVWGDAFMPNRDGRSQEITDSRIAAILHYLETIQARTAH